MIEEPRTRVRRIGLCKEAPHVAAPLLVPPAPVRQLRLCSRQPRPQLLVAGRAGTESGAVLLGLALALGLGGLERELGEASWQRAELERQRAEEGLF